MGYLQTPVFGPGTTSDKTHVSVTYNLLQALSDGDIDRFNFSHIAEISETHIDWDTHNHKDGTLAENCIKDVHFNRSAGSSTASRVLYTQNAKTLVVFGQTLLGYNFPISNTAYAEVDVDFAMTSEGGVTFLPGTIPVVFPSLYMGYPDVEIRMFLTSVSSYGFSVAIFTSSSTTTSLTGYITYVAIGEAPGIVVRPQ